MSAIHSFSAASLPAQPRLVAVSPTTEPDVSPNTVPKNPEATQKVGAPVPDQAPNNSHKNPQERSANDKSNRSETNDQSSSKKLQLLTESELKQVEQLRQRDREVKAHEAAHLAVAGQHATSGAKFTYTRGPDGRSYAVGGSVGIDLSAEADPEATVRKADQIKRAALAPAEPSSQDRSVAAAATALRVKAQSDLVKLKAEEQKAENEAKQSDNITTNDSEQAEDQNSELNGLAAATGALETSSEMESDKKSTADSAEKNDSTQSCAVCGGSHGSEGHVNANRKKLEGSYGELLPPNRDSSPISPLSLLA